MKKLIVLLILSLCILLWMNIQPESEKNLQKLRNLRCLKKDERGLNDIKKGA